MEKEQIQAQIVSILKKNYLPLGIGLIGLIFFVYGLISLMGSNSLASKDIIFEPGADSAMDTEANSLIVDVSGAVVKPGVYKLSSDARIQEALIAAGGLSSTADRVWVSKSINLASRLADGSKIYIPIVGENAPPSGTALGVQSNISGLININSASEKELDTLPGIGPVTAQKIINGRPYSSVDDLLSKKIVGSKVFSDIKDRITY